MRSSAIVFVVALACVAPAAVTACAADKIDAATQEEIELL